MNRQDGPLLVGALNENTNVAKPLLVNTAGELLVTGGGSGGGDVNLIEVGGSPIALGQAMMANSLPVAIASDQTPVPVSGTVTATNASVSATGAAVPASATYVGRLDASGNLAGLVSGHGLAATAIRVELPTDGTGTLATVGTVSTITNAVTVSQATAASLNATVIGAGAAGTANAGVVTVQGIASMTPVQVSQATATNLKAEVIGAGTAGTANAGVVTVQGIASMTPVQVSQATASTFNAQVVGNIAHDSADSGNPVKVGNKAISYGANPTGVTANDRTDAYANVAGIPFVLGGHPNVLTLLANYTSAQTNTAIVAVSGGTKIVLLACTVAADHANTVDVQARVGFATATTPTTTSVYLSHPGIAPGSGIREAGAVAGADGEDVRITCEVPTGGSIDVVVKYFTIES